MRYILTCYFNSTSRSCTYNNITYANDTLPYATLHVYGSDIINANLGLVYTKKSMFTDKSEIGQYKASGLLPYDYCSCGSKRRQHYNETNSSQNLHTFDIGFRCRNHQHNTNKCDNRAPYQEKQLYKKAWSLNTEDILSFEQ